MSTFRELVNSAILESGSDLDEIGISEFNNPRHTMQRRFKSWVQQAWKDIQLDRDDWDYKTGRASCFVYPAIYIEGGDRATAPPVGAVFVGQDSGFTFEVVQVITHEGTWAGGDASATIYMEITNDGSGDFKFNELFDETGPTPATDILRCKGWGRTNFVADLQLPDLVEVHQTTLMIQTTGGSATQAGVSGVGLQPVEFVPFARWQEQVEPFAGGRAEPKYYTVTPEGDLDFWPRPDKEYVLAFHYTKSLNTLTAHTDEPAGIPAEYHDAIFWKALMYYGDYDNKINVERRATKRYTFYKAKMEKRLMPVVTYGKCRYDE